MGWQDRPYHNEGYDDGLYGRPEFRLKFPRIGTAVMWLLIANVAVHFLNVLITNALEIPLYRIFGLSLMGLKSGMLWEPVTYMFMHSTQDIWHLVANMIGLYIFGSEFEKAFGTKRFLQFYATCGLIGGLGYVVLGLLSSRFAAIPLVGASGAIYGLLIAAIIFFPHIQVILIIFPVPIRVFGMIILGILLLNGLSGNLSNPGGEVCHITGALTGLAIFHYWGVMPRIRLGSGTGPTFAERRRRGAWERKQRRMAEQSAEVDRILAKVHDEGIQSLSRKERKTLEEATRSQQRRDSSMGRIDRL